MLHNRNEKVDEAIKLVQDIDKVAKNTCVRVSNPAYAYPGAYITGGKRTGLYLVDRKIPEKKNILETLRNTYKLVIKEADKADEAYEKYKLQVQKGEVRANNATAKIKAKQERQEKWAKFKADLKEKFSNNPISQFFAQKAQLKQQKVEKIAEQLKIG